MGPARRSPLAVLVALALVPSTSGTAARAEAEARARAQRLGGHDGAGLSLSTSRLPLSSLCIRRLSFSLNGPQSLVSNT